MRQLIYVPVIHSEADMGSMAEPLKKEFTEQFGVHVWKEHVKAVDEMWEGIAKKLNGADFNVSQVRIYQDGLPICGREMDIVRDVAAQGSQNHRLVLSLVERGAHLEGSEDAKLLLKEYRYIKSITDEPDPKRKLWKARWLRWPRKRLLIQRDRFIAQRIAQTLKEGETGVLFAGLTHRIDKHLPKDVKVTYLISRLPFKRLRQS
jgi:hypothetical protein